MPYVNSTTTPTHTCTRKSLSEYLYLASLNSATLGAKKCTVQTSRFEENDHQCHSYIVFTGGSTLQPRIGWIEHSGEIS